MRTNTGKSKLSNKKAKELKQKTTLTLAEQLLYFICNSPKTTVQIFPSGKVSLQALSKSSIYVNQNSSMEEMIRLIMKSNYIEIANQVITIFEYINPVKENKQHYYQYRLHKKVKPYLHLFQNSKLLIKTMSNKPKKTFTTIPIFHA